MESDDINRSSDNGAVALERMGSGDLQEIRAFLHEADLTLSGLDDTTVQLWIERDEHGNIIGSTGFELSANQENALIRSVAVAPRHRSAGTGTGLAQFAIDQARAAGATRAWLFSRRSGPFWQKLGFSRADRNQLAAALPDAHQVLLFTQTGQLEREVAWQRPLDNNAR
ncbi:GNAT family N-acetyltransferase [Microbacterium sp. NPDC019599]|uniref:GNAT family N-acetyltransferase n=1 Tax=Microbacterium sp. NPDC019599 TaxID=3154690 RepID=UPI0033CB7AEE